MADTIDKIINDGDSSNANPDANKWQEIVGNKYKSPDELAKAHKELEKKLSELGDKVKNAEQFAQVVNPILEEVRNDPEIFNKLDKKLREKANRDATDDKRDDKKQDNNITEELRTSASDLIIARFEENYGVSKLPAEERKNLRQKIGDVILDLTEKQVGDVDLRKLNSVLENAYVLATKDTQKKSDDSDDSDNGDGAIGSIKSSQGKGESKLNSEEAKVAEALGLTREQYLSGKTK